MKIKLITKTELAVFVITIAAIVLIALSVTALINEAGNVLPEVDKWIDKKIDRINGKGKRLQ